MLIENWLLNNLARDPMIGVAVLVSLGTYASQLWKKRWQRVLMNDGRSATPDLLYARPWEQMKAPGCLGSLPRDRAKWRPFVPNVLRVFLLCGLVMVSPILVHDAHGGGVGKALLRGAGKALQRLVSPTRPAQKAMLGVLKRDAARDARTAVRSLPREKTVFRYTSRSQVARELRTGLAPGTHMTAKGGSGRALGAGAAQARYGLPKRPEVRETVRLPAGFPARSNKSIGGSVGVGEITSPKRVPSAAVWKVTPLRP